MIDQVHYLKSTVLIGVDQMRALLKDYPDNNFVIYVTNGLQHGFNMSYKEAPRHQSTFSLQASKHPEFITLALLVARTKAKTFGPISAKPFDVIKIFGVGVVPKTKQNI